MKKMILLLLALVLALSACMPPQKDGDGQTDGQTDPENTSGVQTDNQTSPEDSSVNTTEKTPDTQEPTVNPASLYREIDGISGATVTTDAYLRGIKHAYDALAALEGGEGQ